VLQAKLRYSQIADSSSLRRLRIVTDFVRFAHAFDEVLGES
jgi:hypothetical protein